MDRGWQKRERPIDGTGEGRDERPVQLLEVGAIELIVGDIVNELIEGGRFRLKGEAQRLRLGERLDSGKLNTWIARKGPLSMCTCDVCQQHGYYDACQETRAPL